MKRRHFLGSRTATRLLALTTIITTTMLPCGGAWAVNANAPLSTVTNPVFGTTGGTVPATAALPNGLTTYVKDVNAAIRLGKSLFWDMQVGSDGVTACASCHYRAGADPLSARSKNELNPGPNGTFDVIATGANSTVTAANFPFTQLAALQNPVLATLTPFDDVMGSQGVAKFQFVDVVPGSRVDSGTSVPDTVFQSGGVNVRQVTGRNTPSAINAVFNYANFWDGRANNTFNGNNPIGALDPAQAGIFVNTGTVVDPILTNQKVAIPNASLASQATGPPLSPVEMSFGGRTFPQLGKKMLTLTPLDIQQVSPTDSVLGAFSNSPAGKGLIDPATKNKMTYAKMIQDAFADNLWNANLPVTININTVPTTFTQMEANFSMFWGLSVMLYEATLVSDQTPFDQFLGGNAAAMSAAAQSGFGLFKGKCDVCHSGNETTMASVSAIGGVLTNLIESNNPARTNGLTDRGFTNIGVRPTSEDQGRGASINFPLSFAAQAEMAAGGIPIPAGQTVNPFAPATSPLPIGVAANTALQVDGAFKIPALRNVALNAPYFHNGEAATLDQVLDLYNRGGNFANSQQDKAMAGTSGLFNGAANRTNMLAFLNALTDPRVAAESAPFDHPELLIPNGDATAPTMTRLPAKSAAGAAETALPTVTLTALPATVSTTNVTISGTKEAGASVKIEVNGGTPLPADTSTDTTWSTKVASLSVGNNTIAVTATPLDGVTTTVSTSVTAAIPTGILTGSTSISVSDALKALRISVGLIQPTPADLASGDVAPLVNGVPAPDGQITVADALVILRKVIGLEHF